MAHTFAPLPVRTATNAYELVDNVIAAIREEPRRLDMSIWINSLLGCEEETVEYLADGFPACGTTACFAGWITALTFDESQTQVSFYSDSIDAQARALFVLCGPRVTRPEGCDGYWAISRNCWVDYDPDDSVVIDQSAVEQFKAYVGRERVWKKLFIVGGNGRVGTAAYAESVIAQIQAVQEKQADFLRSRLLTSEAIRAVNAVDYDATHSGGLGDDEEPIDIDYTDN